LSVQPGIAPSRAFAALPKVSNTSERGIINLSCRAEDCLQQTPHVFVKCARPFCVLEESELARKLE
jgi:hypothetical protein